MMSAGQVYPVLVRSLENWRARSPTVLATLVGAPAEVDELQLDGEFVRIETSVAWADTNHQSVLVEAVAYGSGSWLTERVAERLRIELRPKNGCGDV